MAGITSFLSLTGYFTLFPGGKPETRMDITEITSQHYKLESRGWDGKVLSPLKTEAHFKHRTDAVMEAQKKISDRRWTTEKYLTPAFIAAWVFDRCYFGTDHTLTLKGWSFSITTLAFSSWVASIIFARITEELFNWKISLRDPLTAHQQKLKFSQFQVSVSRYAAIALGVFAGIGFCVHNKTSVTQRLENLFDSKTVLLVSICSMLGCFSAIQYFDRQKAQTEQCAQNLAKWIITEFDRLNPKPS